MQRYRKFAWRFWLYADPARALRDASHAQVHVSQPFTLSTSTRSGRRGPILQRSIKQALHSLHPEGQRFNNTAKGLKPTIRHSGLYERKDADGPKS